MRYCNGFYYDNDMFVVLQWDDNMIEYPGKHYAIYVNGHCMDVYSKYPSGLTPYQVFCCAMSNNQLRGRPVWIKDFGSWMI